MSEKVTIEDMEKAIKELEAEGYVNVKVVACSYWKCKGGLTYFD